MNIGLVLWVLLPICSDPPSYLVRDHVDLVEVNHFFDSDGNFVLDQVIYYNWSTDDTRFHVADYRLFKSPLQNPIREIGTNHFSVWQDGSILRCIQSDGFAETWTQNDPEHRERVILPNDERIGLGTIHRAAWR
jgi:hypothetical protein